MHQMNARREPVRTDAGRTQTAELEPQVLSIAEMEKNAILSTIRQLRGDKLMAARLLGIGKTTLYRKLKEYGLGEDRSLI
jgi:two-component system response regulator HydG